MGEIGPHSKFYESMSGPVSSSEDSDSDEERAQFAAAHLEALEKGLHFTIPEPLQAQQVMSSEQSDDSMDVDAEIMAEGIVHEDYSWDVPADFKDKKDFAKLCQERGIPELEIPRGKVPRKNVVVLAAWCTNDGQLRDVLNQYHKIKGTGARTGFIDPYRMTLKYTRAHNREKRRALLKSEKALERKAEKMKDPAYQEKMKRKAEQRKEKNKDPRVKAKRLEQRRVHSQILQSLKKRYPAEFEAIKAKGIEAVQKFKVRHD